MRIADWMRENQNKQLDFATKKLHYFFVVVTVVYLAFCFPVESEEETTIASYDFCGLYPVSWRRCISFARQSLFSIVRHFSHSISQELRHPQAFSCDRIHSFAKQIHSNRNDSKIHLNFVIIDTEISCKLSCEKPG